MNPYKVTVDHDDLIAMRDHEKQVEEICAKYRGPGLPEVPDAPPRKVREVIVMAHCRSGVDPIEEVCREALKVVIGEEKHWDEWSATIQDVHRLPCQGAVVEYKTAEAHPDA